MVGGKLRGTVRGRHFSINRACAPDPAQTLPAVPPTRQRRRKKKERHLLTYHAHLCQTLMRSLEAAPSLRFAQSRAVNLERLALQPGNGGTAWIPRGEFHIERKSVV